MNNERVINKYFQIVSFAKKFGIHGDHCGFNFWEYNDGDIRLFVRDFFRNSSFLIIETKNDANSTFVIYYEKTNTLNLKRGSSDSLDYAHKKSCEIAPIKELLNLR